MREREIIKSFGFSVSVAPDKSTWKPQWPPQRSGGETSLTFILISAVGAQVDAIKANAMADIFSMQSLASAHLATSRNQAVAGHTVILDLLRQHIKPLTENYPPTANEFSCFHWSTFSSNIALPRQRG